MVTITYAWPPLPAHNSEQVAARLSAALQTAWDRVDDEYRHVLTLAESGARTRALARLDELRRATQAYQDEVERIAPEFVRTVLGEYAAGAAAGATAVGGTNTWTLFDRNATASLASDSYRDLLARSQQAGRTSAAFARAVRTTASEFIPGGATGQTLVQAGRDWRRALEQRHGLSAVTYANGARVDIGTYTEMAVRTKGRVAYNSGALARYDDAGVGYVEVYDGASCGWTEHGDDDLAHGKIVSLRQAAEYPVAHPNCRRSFGPRPDVTSDRQARETLPFSSEPPEDMAPPQQASAAERAEARRERTAARRAERAGA